MIKLSNKSVRRCGTALAAVLLILAASTASARTGDQVYTFNIPAENTAKALNDFARQANLQIMFPYDLAARHTAPAISGQFTRADVLVRLLDGTGLEVAEQTDTSVTLRVATPAGAKPSAVDGTGSTEVIVTGTHIRGGNPTSPVRTIGRREIEQSGYSQIGDLVRSLPENFAGGQNPGVIAAGATNIGNGNYTNGSSVNLRGLGSDATLTLLNGHRLSADATNPASDISGIPLAALQRVEVVTDGASALYGSDAIAGVVNFITRKTFNGAEVTANVGDSSQGGGYLKTYSALAGIARSDWHLLGNIEYSKQNAVLASQRPSLNAETGETALFQQQTRRSLFLNAGWDFADRASLSFDGLVSDRSSVNTLENYGPASLTIAPYDTPSYSGTLSLDFGLGRSWKVHAVAGQSGSHNSEHEYRPASNSSSYYYYRNSIAYTEVTADGVLFSLPSGDVKAAVGAGRRREAFSSLTSGTGDRTVDYGYAELYAPLVAPSDTRVGLHALELSLSGRTEHYSDVGSTSNPKVGLRYVPFDGLSLRATAGTSFKAPSMVQLHSAGQLYIYPGFIFSQPSNVVFITFGRNPELKPETSRSWTMGADYTPQTVPSLKLSATYFEINYRNRIINPIQNLILGLSDPIYADYIERSPSAARQSELITQADVVTNLVGTYAPADVSAVIQDKFTNALAQSSRGLDVSYRQSFSLGEQSLDTFANATWTHFDQRSLPSVPVVTLSGVVFNVPKLKARAGVNWERGGWSATGIVNYVAAESNTAVEPNESVGSWTTADATLTYRFTTTTGPLSGIRLALAINNVTDRKPPYVKSSGLDLPAAIYYDSTNASAMGRFVSLSVTKAW